MAERVIIVDEKGRGNRPRRLTPEQIDNLGRVIDQLERLLPYVAAATYGALAGYHNEKDWLGATRVGCEAIIFMDLAKTLPSNGLTPSPTQVFGIAGLTAIGLSIPAYGAAEGVGAAWEGFVKWLQSLKPTQGGEQA